MKISTLYSDYDNLMNDLMNYGNIVLNSNSYVDTFSKEKYLKRVEGTCDDMLIRFPSDVSKKVEKVTLVKTHCISSTTSTQTSRYKFNGFSGEYREPRGISLSGLDKPLLLREAFQVFNANNNSNIKLNDYEFVSDYTCSSTTPFNSDTYYTESKIQYTSSKDDSMDNVNNELKGNTEYIKEENSLLEGDEINSTEHHSDRVDMEIRESENKIFTTPVFDWSNGDYSNNDFRDDEYEQEDEEEQSDWEDAYSSYYSSDTHRRVSDGDSYNVISEEHYGDSDSNQEYSDGEDCDEEYLEDYEEYDDEYGDEYEDYNEEYEEYEDEPEEYDDEYEDEYEEYEDEPEEYDDEYEDEYEEYNEEYEEYDDEYEDEYEEFDDDYSEDVELEEDSAEESYEDEECYDDFSSFDEFDGDSEFSLDNRSSEGTSVDLEEEFETYSDEDFGMFDSDDEFGIDDTFDQSSNEGYEDDLNSDIDDYISSDNDISAEETPNYKESEDSEIKSLDNSKEELDEIPKDLISFLRKYPKCDISFALQYFSKKEIDKNLQIMRVFKRGNKLYL